MGIGFMASYRRWDFHFQPSFPKRFQYTPSTFRGSESLLESGRSSQHFSVEVEWHLHPLKPCAGMLHNMESVSIYEESSKIYDMNICKGAYNSYVPMKMIEDASPYVANHKSSSHLQFNLLMENIDEIEDIITGKNLPKLERDILTHVGNLGALQLFEACLSKTLDPNITNSNILFTKNSVANTIVSTGKKEERKLKRSKATAKMNEKFEYPKSSAVKRSLSGHKRSKSRNRKFCARNEAEMSKGVKDIAELEITRTKLEENLNHPTSHACWAETAGIDQKTLQQRLQIGWYCRDRLIRSTYSLVVYLAKKYRGKGIAFDDLLQAGKMGVLKGAERFDSTRGYRFSTYVQYWIRKSMLALLDRHSKGIIIPVTMERIIKKMHAAKRDFYDSEGRYPQDEEIAELTGISVDNVTLARKCTRVAGSIDKEIVSGWRTKFMEVIPDTTMGTPEEIIMKQHIKKDIMQILESLESRERQVIELRYGLYDGRCKSLGEIAKLCSVTKEWIRKIEKSALIKIKSNRLAEGLKFYMNS